MAGSAFWTVFCFCVVSTFASARSIHPRNETSKSTSGAYTCSDPPTTLYLPEAPYSNYFYSDCHAATQVVVTSPEPDSNLTLIGPRLLVAWPAGNSGVVAYFEPQNGVNGSLAIKIVNDSSYGASNTSLRPVYQQDTPNPINGVSSLINFNSSATLTIPILGSIRTIRDFSEGPSIIVPSIQAAVRFRTIKSTGTELQRTWFDNVTTTTLSFVPHGTQGETTAIKVLPNGNTTVTFTPGTYEFTASFNYPQLTQVPTSGLYRPTSQELVASQPGLSKALSFLSYTDKLLAGAWRFLTYFGRDSMISLLLLEPILRRGADSPNEAVIAAVLERLNSTDATVCHEETIGDYATYLHMTEDNTTSTDPSCNYVMIDTDYYLPIILQRYFLGTSVGRRRRAAFLSTKSTLDFGNAGRSYGELAAANAQRILSLTAPFAASGGQTKQNLLHLNSDQPVGQWRDSDLGLGSGRIPFDVNTALAPAALRAISELASASFYPLADAKQASWANRAKQAARIWERATLPFFHITAPKARAKQAITSYKTQSNFSGPSHATSINGPVDYYAIALDGGTPGTDPQAKVRVQHSDTAFRLFFLPYSPLYSGAQAEKQASHTGAFLRRVARSVLMPFPTGLSTGVGMLVANPAYGALASPAYAANFTTADYHGTVVWSFPMAMMAKGLEAHLRLCSDGNPSKGDGRRPAYCADGRGTYALVKRAYNHLWDLIEANRQYLSGEVWSWRFAGGKYEYVPLSALSPTESDIRQLWSLTFLAVERDERLR